MKFSLNVPSIACEACANTIVRAIQNQHPEAQVAVDVDRQTVTVEAAADGEAIARTIAGAGHTVADYREGE